MSQTQSDNFTSREPWCWLVQCWNWPHAALFSGVLLLFLTPVLLHNAGLALTLVYLQLPVYMLHQWEEHFGDRFRLYVNRTIGGGREALTPTATFWINALGVWAVDLVALYLASNLQLAYGLMAIYLPLVNSLGHIIPSVVRREYNPGLWTTLGLFVPFGIWSLLRVSADSQATVGMHILGIGVAIGVHVAIMAHVGRRLKHLSLHGEAELTEAI